MISRDKYFQSKTYLALYEYFIVVVVFIFYFLNKNLKLYWGKKNKKVFI